MIVRSRNADPLARRARGSGKMLRRKLAALAKDENLKREIVCGRILEDLKKYLGSKLRRAGSALTSEEIKNKLEKRGISSELTQSLLGIIEVCEHGRYAGASAPGENDTGSLIDRAKDIAVRLDKKL
jgi:hypothetical protein